MAWAAHYFRHDAPDLTQAFGAVRYQQPFVLRSSTVSPCVRASDDDRGVSVWFVLPRAYCIRDVTWGRQTVHAAITEHFEGVPLVQMGPVLVLHARGQYEVQHIFFLPRVKHMGSLTPHFKHDSVLALRENTHGNLLQDVLRWFAAPTHHTCDYSSDAEKQTVAAASEFDA